MIKEVLKLQKDKKLIIQWLLFFIAFLSIFTIVDHLNTSYAIILDEFGGWILSAHILLNVVMSFLSALMYNLSSGLLKLSSKEGKGSFLTGIAIIFGIVTYGCTPCVVAFLSVVGITLVVTVLPFAGLLYKVIAFGILILGLIILLLEIKYIKCKVNLPKEQKN